MTDNIFNPFYDYLEQRRRILLDELAQIERLLGTSPSTSELRKAAKQIVVNKADSVVGVVEYSQG